MEQSVVTHLAVRPGYSYSFAVSEFYAYGRTYGIMYRHQQLTFTSGVTPDHELIDKVLFVLSLFSNLGH